MDLPLLLVFKGRWGCCLMHCCPVLTSSGPCSDCTKTNPAAHAEGNLCTLQTLGIKRLLNNKITPHSSVLWCFGINSGRWPRDSSTGILGLPSFPLNAQTTIEKLHFSSLPLKDNGLTVQESGVSLPLCNAWKQSPNEIPSCLWVQSPGTSSKIKLFAMQSASQGTSPKNKGTA